MDRNRQIILGCVLAIVLLLSAVVLRAVLQTIVFTITVAYVLFPIKRWLRRRGASDRIASAIATLTAFFTVVLVFAPLLFILYQRRGQLVETIRSVPELFHVTVLGTRIEIETDPIIDAVVEWIRELAVGMAVAAPELLLQLGLFTLLLYGILYQPRKVRAAVFDLVPPQYHDIVTRLHDRTRMTLFALYVLQLLTAVATFGIALVLFWLLGYEAPLTLATIAGILQFIPILGPSLLVVAIAANDVLIGMPLRAVAILGLGLAFIAFTPDALIRTKLAGYTGKLSPTLYFVGFVGGILTIGAIGIILGPLVVALLVEVLKLLAERSDVDEAEEPPTTDDDQPTTKLPETEQPATAQNPKQSVTTPETKRVQDPSPSPDDQ